MPRRSTLRASDADREHIADRLRRAAAEGRLLTEELEERLGRVFAARTYGELDVLVADLPHGAVTSRSPRALQTVRRMPLPALVVLAPIAVAMAMAAVVIVTTLFAAWALVVALAWLVMGRRAAMYGLRPRRPVHAHPRWRA